MNNSGSNSSISSINHDVIINHLDDLDKQQTQVHVAPVMNSHNQQLF